jgi:hypothetical protein
MVALFSGSDAYKPHCILLIEPDELLAGGSGQPLGGAYDVVGIGPIAALKLFSTELIVELLSKPVAVVAVLTA